MRRPARAAALILLAASATVGSLTSATAATASATAATATAGATAETDAPAADLPEASPVSVSLIVPLTVPISEGASVPADTLETQTAPGGDLDAVLWATIDTAVTYAIDPMLIASIRGLGADAPASATAWLDRLAAATNPTFPLAWADSDLTAPLQAGRDRVLTTSSLRFLVDPSGFAAASDDDDDATPAPDGALQPVPTDDELVAWDYTLPTAAWPRDDTVTAADLAILAHRRSSPTIVTSTNVQRIDELAAATTVSKADVLVTDDAGSELLQAALGAADDEVWQQAIDALTASVGARSLAAPATSQRSIVLALDRTSPVPTMRLAATIDALGSAQAVRLVGLDTVAALGPAAARLVDEPQSGARVKRVAELLDAERRDVRAASVADDPAALAGLRRARLLVTLSPGAEDPPGGWQGSALAFLAESEALRTGVSIAPTSPFSLLADHAAIPVTVQNDLDVPVTVYVTIDPMLPLIDVEDAAVPLRIEPRSQARADVPVRSIANGNVELAISLRTAGDAPVGTTLYVRTSVQAGWEGPVTVVFAALVVAVFALGIARGIVRRRRGVRADSAAAADDVAPPENAPPENTPENAPPENG
ncbi:DUF6049 family protein [Galbitalea sp. SE-J8]|uniref:DUF6049 family protein n=1 Tax=Galbitalea sp. SE-J8 TaxID=3054952 RepID=UPI00259C684E|nr:DUF6049 family protein [Galbitalea sp. SE-J8]MDM4762337.1 DUF6049 family protein [Galbitalea sp. SE-J8]